MLAFAARRINSALYSVTIKRLHTEILRGIAVVLTNLANLRCSGGALSKKVVDIKYVANLLFQLRPTSLPRCAIGTERK